LREKIGNRKSSIYYMSRIKLTTHWTLETTLTSAISPSDSTPDGN
jgi:hypothetical protein